MASPPETQYAKSGDLHIAYQVTGSEERRVHTLKDVPGEWRLFAVSSAGR